LVELGGGEWGLVAKLWSVASPRSFKPTGMCPGHADERGKGQGEVSAWSHCEVGSGWCWSGGAGHWLRVRGGGGRKEREGEDLP
jgi:hypothetical protein